MRAWRTCSAGQPSAATFSARRRRKAGFIRRSFVEGILHDRRQHRLQRRRHARREIWRDARFRHRAEGISADGRIGGVGHGDEEIFRGFQFARPLDRQRRHARRRHGRGAETDSAAGGALDAARRRFRTSPRRLRAALALFRARVQPAICEFLDRESVLCAERATGKPCFPAGGPAGDAARTRRQSKAEVAGSTARAGVGAGACAGASGGAHPGGGGELWAVRRKCSGAMFELGDAKLNEDIVVPMRSYEKFARFLAAAET